MTDTLTPEALTYLKHFTEMKDRALMAHQAFTQMLAAQYKIGPDDTVDVLTGVITRAKAVA